MKKQVVQTKAAENLKDAAITNNQAQAIKGGTYTLQPGDQKVALIDAVRNVWQIRLASGDFIVEDVLEGS